MPPLICKIQIQHTRHYNLFLIINRSWILTIHKAKGHSTRMNLKNWVKSIQTAGYNGVRPVYATPISAYFWTSWRISIGCHNKRRHSLIFSNAASVYLMGFCKKLKCHKVVHIYFNILTAFSFIMLRITSWAPIRAKKNQESHWAIKTPRKWRKGSWGIYMPLLPVYTVGVLLKVPFKKQQINNWITLVPWIFLLLGHPRKPYGLQ